MEINVVGRRMDVPDRFRRHLEDKLEKVTQLAPTALRVDVEVSHENNPRQSDLCDRVELTVYEAGTVIRSEARADDLYAALDVAYGKLLERLRRARDRRKDQRRGRERLHGAPTPSLRTMVPEEQSEVSPIAGPQDAPADVDEAADEGGAADPNGTSPVVIREKRHRAIPMTIDDALYQMELVGHDFFLFIDAESGNPKVVYRRKGWDYGVIELEGANAS